MTSNNEQSNKELEELWELEKQLICSLEEYDLNKSVCYNKKNKFSEDGISPTLSTNTHKTQSPQIILSPHSLGHSNMRNEPPARFTGGSMAERIRHLEQMLGESSPEKKEQKKFLTFEENSVELEQIERILGGTANRQITSKNEADVSMTELEQKIHTLSSKILELRKKAGLKELICDKTTARDINILMGGDGTYLEDGETMIVPNIPLGKTCPHQYKEGQYPLILRCVVCPANYGDSTDRLETWLSYVKKRQENNKQKKQEQL